MSGHTDSSSQRHAPAAFTQTRWSLVAAVRSGKQTPAEPLAQLSEGYWFPVYAHIRQQGWTPATAHHLTERFFGDLGEQIRTGRPAGFGRFRLFLLDRLQAFLTDQVGLMPIDSAAATVAPAVLEALESRLRSEQGTAGSGFGRSFALQLLAGSRQRLEQEAIGLGRGSMYTLLAPWLARDPDDQRLQAIATELGIGRLAVQMAIRRLRLRFREFVEAELTETVTSPEELEAERASLWRELAGDA